MKRLLLLALLLVFSQLSFGQAANIPTCNGTNGPNCTDYFGVGNWANSPLPSGTITGFTLVAGGSGYASPVVTITDPTGGSGASATATATGGVITSVTGSGGSGYTMPQVAIVDVGVGGTLQSPTCGGINQPACGSGAMATANIGGPFVGGMQKFIDPLADLKTLIASPDTATFSGSDYYEIQLVQYTQKMHGSLAPTMLRGYVQVPTGTAGCLGNPARYLGPVILAQKGRPVRVKFTNCLPTGAGGDLFIPVDTTYMGADQTYTQSRATLHLHGGATPWISDGTPHQWTVPVGDAASKQKGDSVAYVPDMWFDGASGAVIPACAGKSTCATPGATINPGQGALTFFWTNDQGGRLMFYHDHAYGLTRLNVYAGEAAGYLLYDPAEENALAAGTAPGTITTGDLTHLIPLVIQDKTFVPSAAQIAAQDPTWVPNFGTNKGSAVVGDLWFPHVYIPNQNPADTGGSNAFGRWDYGPWFFPPQTTLTAGSPNPTDVTTACTSGAFPGQTLAPTQACPTCGCPIIPNPSGTPEGFMDTPVVNGVAYPVLHVAPAAYRFKILSAGNDRSLNLSWFVADATGKEVAMLPAVPPGPGANLPLCTAINPVAVPSLDLGLVTALLDNSGSPINGTGLPPNCWPNYGPQQGIPAPQTMWAADGRAGGSPDPRTAGPAWVQVGSEGGLLPTPVVIPATPINFEQNPRSITIGSVAMHGLWLGPAERADVIVDFSKFAGQTLILYNDAPTPAPAFDSRLDYFTGDGDQTAIGGAPNTQPGYGPNTRTVMQVVVDGNGSNLVPFSLSALKSTFASTPSTPGVFASTQPTTIVPEPGYNSAYNGNFPQTYGSIQANTLTFTPITAQTFDQSCGTNCAVLGQKTIQELFTLDYGRMNATLGTELPNNNFLNQTTIPLGYVDPATEIVRQGQTQLWKITHNGVDTHFIHFHLFNVQVINRVGWDGTTRPPDANELGWKDTVRMNPLEDILVALQPITPPTPFPLANSVRLLDVTMPANMGGSPPFSNLNPYTNAGVTTVNALQNFGWEYVWHCHILGHEENDMMRPIIFQVPPPAPANLTANAVSNAVTLTFTDNSASETGFVIQRSTDSNFVNPAPTTIAVGPSANTNPAGEGTDWGGTVTVQDTLPDLVNAYFYRVQAVDNGWLGSVSQSYNEYVLGSSATCGKPVPPGTPVNVGNCPLVSGWSNVVTPTAGQIAPTVSFTGAPLTAVYNTQFVVNATTNASTMPTITAAGVCTVGAVTGTPANAAATVTITSGTGSCSLTANWAADAAFLAATATQTTTAVPATPTVSFTGAPATAINGAKFTVTATTNAGIAPTINGTANVCTVSNVNGTSPATATVTMVSGTGTCTMTAAWGATTNYSVASATQVTIASLATPTVSFTGAPANMVYNSGFNVTATTNANVMPTITPTGVCSVGPVTGSPTNATATVTMTSGTGTCSVTANWPPTSAYLAASLSQSTAALKLGSKTAITSNAPNPSVVGQVVNISFNVTETGGAALPTGTVTVTATTGEQCSGSLTAGVGSCNITFVTPGSRTLTALYNGDANYNTSSSAVITQGVGDFSIGVTPASQTINGNQSAKYTLTLTPVSGFKGTVTLSCSSTPVLPPGYSCGISPVSVTLNGSTQRATVTVNTTRGNPNTYNLTFTGKYSYTGGTLSHATSATLIVKR
jgi:FtsP/CotA-like multicopper oxidase with cupredoxin domain